MPILLKPPLALGCVYYAVRRDWRALAEVAAATGAVVALSAALAPQLWLDWFRFLTSGDVGFQHGFAFFVVRLVAAVALVVWGARTNRNWVVAPALAIASPVFTPPAELALLAVIPRLRSAQAGQVA